MNYLTNEKSVFTFSFFFSELWKMCPTHLLHFNSWHLRQHLSSTILPSLLHLSSPLLLTRGRLPKPLLALWLLGSVDQKVLSFFYWSPSGLPPLAFPLFTHTCLHTHCFQLSPADSDGWHVSTWKGPSRVSESHSLLCILTCHWVGLHTAVRTDATRLLCLQSVFYISAPHFSNVRICCFCLF